MDEGGKFPITVVAAVSFFQLEENRTYERIGFSLIPPFFRRVTRNHFFGHRELVADLDIVEMFERTFDVLPKKGQAIELCAGYAGIVYTVCENGDIVEVDIVIDGSNFDFSANEDEDFADFMKKMREAGWTNLSSGLLLGGH